jgi:hypothetical protein
MARVPIWCALVLDIKGKKLFLLNRIQATSVELQLGSAIFWIANN